MRFRQMQRIKLVLAAFFGFIFAFSLIITDGGSIAKSGKDMPAFIVFDDPEKGVTKHAEGKKPKAPFDHDQHVAKDSCVTCHHTNSPTLSITSDEDVPKC